jgi:hypothetical protein
MSKLRIVILYYTILGDLNEKILKSMKQQVKTRTMNISHRLTQDCKKIIVPTIYFPFEPT